MSDLPTTIRIGPDRNVRVIEEHRSVTPFGLRLWDWATDKPTSAGLTVEARPALGGRATTAVLTRSGAFALSNLPGLHREEHPDVGEDPFAGPGRPFLVRVVDTAGRFNPSGFIVDLPRPGLYPAPGDLAPINGTSTEFPGFPLFSAPGRSMPTGFATIRADLRRRSTPPDPTAQPLLEPASFAVLKVDVGPDSWFGAADGTGACLVTFPFPEFEKPDGVVTPGSSGIDPTTQRFDITVSVRFGRLAANAWIGAPTFDDVRSQSPGRIIAAEGEAATATIAATIAYNQELVLSTTMPSTQDQSVLLIEAA